ncbi:hypothetical protein JF66_14930 [Cryobacterium sp. MLB-32]|nr:hypothetical protein JF66_14930 [Cryobacterium sp. MLB-32]
MFATIVSDTAGEGRLTAQAPPSVEARGTSDRDPARRSSHPAALRISLRGLERCFVAPRSAELAEF